MPYKILPAVQVKVMPTTYLPDVFSHLQPILGAIYDAKYVKSLGGCKDFCVINVNGKKIVMRRDEFVIIGG
jgi:hypothetical protein